MQSLKSYPGTIPATLDGMQTVLQAISRIRLNDQTMWNNLPSQFISGQGITNGGNAQAGYIGEYISASVPQGSAVPLSSGSPSNIASINLTAGDWDILGNIATNPASVTTQTSAACGISTTSGSLPTAPAGGLSNWQGSVSSINPVYLVTGSVRINTTQNTTAYLVGLSTYTNSTTATVSMYGLISGRRAR